MCAAASYDRAGCVFVVHTARSEGFCKLSIPGLSRRLRCNPFFNKFSNGGGVYNGVLHEYGTQASFPFLKNPPGGNMYTTAFVRNVVSSQDRNRKCYITKPGHTGLDNDNENENENVNNAHPRLVE